MDTKPSLLDRTHQTWKLTAAIVLTVAAVALLFAPKWLPTAVMAAHPKSRLASALAGLTLLMSGLLLRFSFIRCPRCGARWMWQAATRRPVGEAIPWFQNLQTCPDCGFAGPPMYKLAVLDGDREVEHSFAPVFVRETTAGTQRIRAGVPSGNAEVFRRLVAATAPPYQLLYVLHTTHGEAPEGRYQSPKLSYAELGDFLTTFDELLRFDSRFDLWARSAADGATIVWDRHNLLYAYGPLDRIEAQLRDLAYSPGEADVSFTHVHYYRTELDYLAQRLIRYFDWIVSPLRPEDQQFHG